MEQLLHYEWKHKLFPLSPLTTTWHQAVEVIDPGLHNRNAGPDFFNAKIKLNGTLWVGNVEIHDKASDWYVHGHDKDERYDNVILHVCGSIDVEAKNSKGEPLVQLQLDIPENVSKHYQELLSIDQYPPCYQIIPSLTRLTVHSWMSALQTERLSQKTDAIEARVKQCNGDWENAYFVTLARNYGFGINGDAFEQWAYHLPLRAVDHHRDDLFQIEAIFLGQAGLLELNTIPERYQKDALNDGYFSRLRNEYLYLSHKFSLQPMDYKQWRFLRLRPQNFPHIRLSQLAGLYAKDTFSLASLTAPGELKEVRKRLETGVSDYWRKHYLFGCESKESDKKPGLRSQNLLVLNSIIPLLFAYGRYRGEESMEQRSLELLASLPAEDNFITRTWQMLGIVSRSAADSQALVHLKTRYCDRRDCLRCSWGHEYLKTTKHL